MVRPRGWRASRPPSSGWPPSPRALQAGAHGRAGRGRGAGPAAARLARPPRRRLLRRRPQRRLDAAGGPRLGAPVVYGALGEVPGRARADLDRAIAARLRPAGAAADRGAVRHRRQSRHPLALPPHPQHRLPRRWASRRVYLPFHTDSFGDFWLEVVENARRWRRSALHPRALGDAPFKESALAVGGAESPMVSLIGAANTLVWNQGVWEAEATDPDGVVLPLRDRGLAIDGDGGGGGRRRRRGAVGGGGARPGRRAGDDVQPRSAAREELRRVFPPISESPLPSARRAGPRPFRSAGQRHLAGPRRGRRPAVRRRPAPPGGGGDRPRLSPGPADRLLAEAAARGRWRSTAGRC